MLTSFSLHFLSNTEGTYMIFQWSMGTMFPHRVWRDPFVKAAQGRGDIFFEGGFIGGMLYMGD